MGAAISSNSWGYTSTGDVDQAELVSMANLLTD